jgi:hypothetical protein
MIIAMLISMSGGRDDDRPWPGVNLPFEVTDIEGEGLVRWGNAQNLTAQGWTLDKIPPHMRLPGTVHVSAPGPVSLPAGTAAGPADNPPAPPADNPPAPDPPLPRVHDLPEDPRPASMTQPVDTEMLGVDDDDPGVDGEPDDDPPERPKPADPKQAWIDYAVSGAPVADRIPEPQASGMSKADLMSRYGGRL